MGTLHHTPARGTSTDPGGQLALDVRDLHVEFRTPGRSLTVIDGVSLQLEQGETLGIVGVSGSGKSVLARTLLGLLPEPGVVMGGSARVLDHGDLLTKSNAQLRALRGSTIALILSNPRSRLNPLLSVGTQVANILAAKQPLSRRDADSRAIELLSSVALGDPHRVARMLPHELSGGMCQRVVIAMALANSPRVLIADEPTFGLDVTVQRQVLELMMSLVQDTGAGLLLMTRDLGIIAHYAKRVCVLENGRIVEDQGVETFFTQPRHPHSKFLLEASFAARGDARSS